jgi:hypothetical protein
LETLAVLRRAPVACTTNATARNINAIAQTPVHCHRAHAIVLAAEPAAPPKKKTIM